MIHADGGFIEIMHGHILKKAKNKFKKRVADIFLMCNVFIPLAIGAYVYIYMDGDSYFGNFVRSLFPIPIFRFNSNLGKIMRNWGCDFLFAYALLFALYGCTGVLPVSIRYTAVCSIGLELLQLIQVDFLKCGTFDVVDIIVEIIAICFGATFIGCFNHIKERKGESEYGRKEKWR